MGIPLEGGCACGAVRYRLAADPLFTHCCHCLNCQRQTGSAFVINVLVEADRVEMLSGAPLPVAVPRDDGSTQRIFRCQACQVAVFSEYSRPEVRFVRGGTLDEPSSVTPDVHIYTRSKLGWIALPASVPAFDEYYDTKALWPAASLARLARALAKASPGGSERGRRCDGRRRCGSAIPLRPAALRSARSAGSPPRPPPGRW